MIKNQNYRMAAFWLLAFGIAFLSSTDAFAQISGTIPGGQYLVQIGDAIFNFIRRYIAPIIIGILFLSIIIGAAAGSVQQGIGRALGVLVIGAFVAAGTVWWPWIKGWYGA